MKPIVLKSTAIIIFLFACVTLFMSTSVIFDLFGIRAKEGNYVLFVVISNFIAGFAYLAAAYGLFKEKKWTTLLMFGTLAMLLISFVALLFHAKSGGLYEPKTIKAMIFRMTLTAMFTVISIAFINKPNQKK